MSDRPIEDLAFLSDCHSAALVGSDGSIDWWCLPRFDGPSVFGRLLDPSAGHFALTPRRVTNTSRRYEDGSLVLTTRFETESGTVELTDALLMADGVRNHDLGAGSPHALARRLRCLEGTVEVDVDFCPRHEYGLTLPLLETVEGDVVARGGATALRLSAPVDLDVDADARTASGTIRLAAGESVGLAVTSGHSWGGDPAPMDGEETGRRIEDTIEAWRSWGAHHQNYEGPHADLVALSGRILQGLTFQPTGAIVAAATTSLPEVVGGDRNWDYRFAWLRDASLTLNALWVAACPDEAEHFFGYLAAAASSFAVREEIQVMFSIQGERDLTERELDWLAGWRDSTPVRVGNDAWHQRQVDVYGSVLDTFHRLADVLGELPPEQRRLLAGLADVAARVWREPDHGIWELRTEPRHHVYSKVMCWVALDRAVHLADRLDAVDRIEEWKAASEEIRVSVLEEGWNDEVGSFTQSYGSTDLDASLLMLPIVGFLPPDDPRVLSTVDAIEADLSDDGGLLRRYRSPDGLEGEEGAFLLCTFWLAEALALAGRLDRATEVFERAIRSCNDVGLLAEEVDASTGGALGNVPQAFSHVGLVNAAWAIASTARG